MKIVYMGTPDFAVAPLKAVLSAGHEVVLVLTQADKPKGRGHEMHFTPVKEAALAAGIPVLQPARMKDPELWKTLREAGADVFVVAAYGKILPKEILDIPRYGCVNIHASLLPAYRGAAPIQWAVIDGQKESGVTTMLMGTGLDTGDILRQYRVELAADETGGSLFDRLTELGAEAIVDTLKGLEAGDITPVKQGETTTAYAAMLTKEDGNADWTKGAEALERLVRGLSPWPGVFTFLDGRMLKVWRTHVAGAGETEAAEKAFAASSGTDAEKAVPGTVLQADGALFVKTGDGVLALDEVQPEGKKRMETAAWLRGARVKPGAVLSAKREGNS